MKKYRYKLIQVDSNYPYPYKVVNGIPLAFEHRVIVEKKIGRYLNFNEVVHHIDLNPLNNNPDNLEVMTISQHKRLHKYNDLNHPELPF